MNDEKNMKDSDVKRIIENLEDALKVHPEGGYEVGSVEEAEEFSRKRNYPLGKNFESHGIPPENKILE